MSERVLDVAYAKQAALWEELKQVERFISDYREFAGLPQNRVRRRVGRGFPGGPRAASEAILAVLQNGEKTRREIADALAEQGVLITSGNPDNYIGTIIWRFLRERVEHGALGYRLKGSTQETA